MLKHLACLTLLGLAMPAYADENLFGYVQGAETLPKGAGEVYLFNTVRAGKGQGSYTAVDTEVEAEYGVTDRIQLSGALNFLSIDTEGLLINAYLPAAKSAGPSFAGLELKAKFNVLSPALDDFGLALVTSVEWQRLDRHSGQKKSEYEGKFLLAGQKYFKEGQLIWTGNLWLKAGVGRRAPIANLPDDIEWPTVTEVEVEVGASAGVSYRIIPKWFVGVEAEYASEYETEAGQERWSLFAGPTLHYGGEKIWATLTWFPQLKGGGEKYDGQINQNLHLVEKTRNEFRFKIGYNF
jgi:hypothetical protein